MKHFIVFIVFGIFVQVAIRTASAQDVSDKVVSSFLRNQRMMRRQLNCLLNKDKCDQMGEKLKGLYNLAII